MPTYGYTDPVGSITAGRKPAATKKPKPTVTPPAPASSGGTDWAAVLKGLSAPANTQGIQRDAKAAATADTMGQINAYRAEQAQILRQAAERAHQVTLASQAAASGLEQQDLGGKLSESLRTAGNDQAALASGFSGGLRDTVGAETAKVQQGLNAIGGAGTAPNTTEQAGNVVYGVGGAIPANAMLAAAPFAKAQADAAPGGLLGYGLEAAKGALGKGREDASRYDSDIAGAIGGQSKLTREYASDYQAVADKHRQSATDNFWKALSAQQDGDDAAADAAYRAATLAARKADRAQAAADKRADRAIDIRRLDETAAHNKATEKISAASAANLAAYRDGQIDLAQFNATTSRLNAQSSRISANASKANAATSAKKAAAAAKTAKKKGGLSAEGYRSLVSDATKQTSDLATSAPVEQRYEPDADEEQQLKDSANNPTGFIAVPGTGRDATPYQDALQQIVELGPNTPAWHKKAVAIVNAKYPMGENGRPYTGAAARKAALTGAKAAYNAGIPYAQALAKAKASGHYPPGVLEEAMKRVYFSGPYSPIPGSPHFPVTAGG